MSYSDVDDLERVIEDCELKWLIFCSAHNISNGVIFSGHKLTHYRKLFNYTIGQYLVKRLTPNLNEFRNDTNNPFNLLYRLSGATTLYLPDETAKNISRTLFSANKHPENFTRIFAFSRILKYDNPRLDVQIRQQSDLSHIFESLQIAFKRKSFFPKLK